MQIEIPEINREAQIKIIEQNGNSYKIDLDGQNYDIDILQTGKGSYSIIYEGKSYNLDAIQGPDTKKYIINSVFTRHEVEIVDAATKYQRSRQGDDAEDGGSKITVPMPGKIVKVFVKPDQEVLKGETLVIVSAMKMESEYKAGKDGIVKEVLVNDGDTVDSGQVMVLLD